MLLDEENMLLALEQARKAEKIGECPIGAVVTDEIGNVIGAGYNTCERDYNPLAHAELVAIKKASEFIKNWRLTGCTLYVTLEPCPMCAGAIVNARIKRLVYGAFDKKIGACASLFNLYDYPLGNKPFVRSRVFEKECENLLTGFFKKIRR